MTTHTVPLTNTLTSLRALLTTAGYTNFAPNFANSDAVIHTMTADYNIRATNETAGVGIPVPSRQLAVYVAGDCLNTLFSSTTAGTLLYIRLD